MPTTTIIILAVMAILLPWTIYHLLKDFIRKIGKKSDIRGRDEVIRDSIETERQKDRERMGSLLSAEWVIGRNRKDGDGG